ncbi:hypothetical protein ACHAW5_000659 [Stephanodiscus triporus]|uniref:Uncharacterized protein n=1 Tax=Stephanodiscus triporus TaxID=2934178 RepID=A0ABD3PFZ1_9STRA
MLVGTCLDNEEECVLASAFEEAGRQCGETSSRGTSCVGGTRDRRTRGRRVSFRGETSSEESSGEGKKNEGTNSSSGTSRGENMCRMNNRVEMDQAGVGGIVERLAEHGAVLGKALASESFTVRILMMMMVSVVLVVLPVSFTRFKCSRGPLASGVNHDTLALGLSLYMGKSRPYQLKKDASMLNPGNYPLEAFDDSDKVCLLMKAEHMINLKVSSTKGSCILKKGQRILIIAYLAAFPFPPAQAETKVSASTFVFKT